MGAAPEEHSSLCRERRFAALCSTACGQILRKALAKGTDTSAAGFSLARHYFRNELSAASLSVGSTKQMERSVKALAWHGKGDIRCESVPDPKIEDPSDVVIKVTACAICGSDLHIYGGIIPEMKSGDVIGHETMGEVVETGSEVRNLKVGDRVVVPFTIGCGQCFFCTRGYFSACERTNPDHRKAAELWGNAPGGLFGYSHLLGGYAGGQAEYLRVPFADVGPIKVPDGLTDEQVLFLSDIFLPATWPPSSATSKAAKPSRSGVAGRSDNSPSAALLCWARSA